MAKTNFWYGVILPIVIACVGTALIVGGLYTLNYPEQSYTKSTVKEYYIFEHNADPPLRVYTTHGIFLFQTQEEWDRLELNHTYTCEETYSNVSLANCTELRGE